MLVKEGVENDRKLELKEFLSSGIFNPKIFWPKQVVLATLWIKRPIRNGGIFSFCLWRTIQGFSSEKLHLKKVSNTAIKVIWLWHIVTENHTKTAFNPLKQVIDKQCKRLFFFSPNAINTCTAYIHFAKFHAFLL